MYNDQNTSPSEKWQGKEPNILATLISPNNSQIHGIPSFVQKYLDGRLFRAEEINMLPKQIISTHFYRIPSIEEKNNFIRCNRCLNEFDHLFGKIPCARCHREHLYCRNCIMMGRVLSCEPLYRWKGNYCWPSISRALQWEGELTRAQKYAAEHIIKQLDRKEDILIWAVTGAGKTEMLFHPIHKALNEGKRICLTSPRVDVVKELGRRLKAVFPFIHIDILYGDSKSKYSGAQFLITTTHQLIRFDRTFDLLIVDEIDAFPYYYDLSLQGVTKRSVRQKHTIVYLTATPRKDFLYQIRKEKCKIIFVPVRYHQHPLPVPNFKYIFSLKNLLQANKPISKIEKWIKNRKYPNRQLLVFFPSVALTKVYVYIFRLKLLDNGILNQKTELDFVFANDPNRQYKIIKFKDKQIKILCTTSILERGVTFPNVDVIVIDAGNEIFDEAALVQIAGRAGRSEKYPSGEVVFFHDGKTEAMEKAKNQIIQMNKRRKMMLENGEDKR